MSIRKSRQQLIAPGITRTISELTQWPGCMRSQNLCIGILHARSICCRGSKYLNTSNVPLKYRNRHRADEEGEYHPKSNGNGKSELLDREDAPVKGQNGDFDHGSRGKVAYLVDVKDLEKLHYVLVWIREDIDVPTKPIVSLRDQDAYALNVAQRASYRNQQVIVPVAGVRQSP